MEMEKTNIKLLIVIAIIVTSVLSTTYALLNVSTSKNTESNQAGCFNVDYTGQILSSNALTSTTDYTKGAHATVTLNKSSDCKIYTEATISLYTGNSTAPLNKPRALNYKIMEGNTEKASGVIKNTSIPLEENETNPVPTNFTTNLLTVTLSTTAKTYDIYLWVDSSKSNGFYHNETYSGYIYATSEQTSTIKQ